MIKIELKCPYCGFKWFALISYEQIYNAAKAPIANMVYQICPGDEYPDACGNGFFYQIEINPTPKKYFMDPTVYKELR